MKESLEGFSKVCKVDDLKEKVGKRFFIYDIEVAVFKVDGKIYALNNICPHQHSALIYDGFIEDCKVICPAHGWEFNLSDGKMDNNRKGLDSYEVKIIDDYVYVKVFKKELNW
ncbi:MAG: Rieske 2Fe-2S domain-containing protein [Melioribacteraceae bacterium]|nr:MAG: Rieske 2Fe-2S domain-containing protein [Melioribacteraceae bacterium]